MKSYLLLLVLVLGSCTSVPTKLYEKPHLFSGALLLDTYWDGEHPVQTFHVVLCEGESYVDAIGTLYKVVPLDDGCFALEVSLDK
tara:strand:- start:338 stop:592 length:255 start_codon:yes stop_codon:yes gene_type:complete